MFTGYIYLMGVKGGKKTNNNEKNVKKICVERETGIPLRCVPVSPTNTCILFRIYLYSSIGSP